MDGFLILSVLLTLCGSLALALVLTPLARALARQWGVVDCPDGKRKLQKSPIPLLGGVAVYLGFAGGVVGLSTLGWLSPDGMPVLPFVVSLGLLCLAGVYDDIWNLRARYKLLAQILCTLPLVLSGCAIERLGFCGYTFELGPWGMALSVLWLVSGINAVNVIDGMDGLAATTGLCISVGVGLLGALSGSPECVLIAAVLVGVQVGFLVFNLPPARIYLGDAGSMVIGLALSTLVLQVATDSANRTSLTLMVVLMAVPLGDLTLAVVRRWLSGNGICSPDRGHIHHRLLDRGFSVGRTLCVVAAICLVAGGLASSSRIIGWEPLAWAGSLVLGVTLVRSRLAGHHEWALTKSTLTRAWLPVGLPLPTQEELANLPFDEVWARLVASGDRLSLQGVELSLHGPHGKPGRQRGNRLHRWDSATRDAQTSDESTVEIVMFSIRAETVRLRLEPAGAATPAGPAWQSLLKAARLAVAHWAESPQLVPGSNLRSPSQPGVVKSPSLSGSRAA